MAEDGEVARATARVGVHAGHRHSVINQLSHADTGHHAHVTEERGDKDGLDDDEPQDGGGAGADGFADAELTRPFADGDEHDVAHAHDAGHECADAHDPDKHHQAAEDKIEHAEVVARVPHAEGTRVRGVEVVAEGHGGAEALLEGGVLFFRLDATHGEDQIVHLHTAAEELLGGGEGDVGGLVVVHLLVAIDADDLEHHAANAHVAPDGILLVEEHLGHAWAEDDRFAALLHVDLVDEASAGGDDKVDGGKVGCDTAQVAVDVFLIVGQRVAMVDAAGVVLHLGKVGAQMLHVGVAEG